MTIYKYDGLPIQEARVNYFKDEYIAAYEELHKIFDALDEKGSTKASIKLNISMSIYKIGERISGMEEIFRKYREQACKEVQA